MSDVDSLFLRRMQGSPTLGKKVLRDSNVYMNHLFTRDVNYKQGFLYDVNCQKLEKVDYKYQYYTNYMINKDRVEFHVQFRPYYHPEIKYAMGDGIERFGFYLDVPNDIGLVEKWLVCGRNDTISFARYNILKCNWTFNWIVDGEIMHALGCLRNRNNYNSGVWSDGFVTSVENEALFIVPTNQITKTIDYDTRFMLSDNEIHPRVYAVSKLEDTFPPGLTKVTLVQEHYDPAVDNAELKICGYYKNAILPIEPPREHWNATLEFQGTVPSLHKAGSMRQVTAVLTDESGNPVTDIIPEWSFKLNGESVDVSELANFTITTAADNYSIRVGALFSATVGDILTVVLGSDALGYYDAIELEVVA